MSGIPPTGREPGPFKAGRIDGLDMVRGGAILLVLLRHAWPDVFGTAGVIGVVVFFTLSGYLITSLLDSELNRYGRVRFRRFYLNRFLRLMPPLVLVVCAYIAVTLAFAPLADRDLLAKSVIVALTYTSNLTLHISAALGHLWTLATEEQYYLIWPALFAFAVRRSIVGTAIAFSAAAIALAFVASTIIFRVDLSKLYSLPSSWAIAMIIGSVASITRPHWRHRLSGSRQTVLAAVALLLLLAAAFLPEDKAQLLLYVLLAPAIAVAAIFIIALAETWVHVRRVTGRSLVALGLISYSAYLWNYPLTIWLRSSGWQLAAPLGIILTVVSAIISWYALERPLAKLRKRRSRRQSDLAVLNSQLLTDPKATDPNSPRWEAT